MMDDLLIAESVVIISACVAENNPCLGERLNRDGEPLHRGVVY